jgi:putative endonuclease
MNQNYRKDAGIEGEAAALRFLTAKGLQLLMRNYRCRGGEIDLVMMDHTTLVLVEVRLRKDLRYGGAAASVDPRKQRRLVLAARHLMMTNAALRKLRARFDVIALTRQAGITMKLDWLRDAFRLE